MATSRKSRPMDDELERFLTDRWQNLSAEEVVHDLEEIIWLALAMKSAQVKPPRPPYTMLLLDLARTFQYPLPPDRPRRER